MTLIVFTYWMHLYLGFFVLDTFLQICPTQWDPTGLRRLELIWLSLLNNFCQVCIFPFFEQGMFFTDRLKMIRFDLNDNRLYWWNWMRSRTGCICSWDFLSWPLFYRSVQLNEIQLDPPWTWAYLLVASQQFLPSVYLSIFWTRYGFHRSTQDD